MTVDQVPAKGVVVLPYAWVNKLSLSFVSYISPFVWEEEKPALVPLVMRVIKSLVIAGDKVIGILIVVKDSFN